ncbi:hypothetical protein Tco_0730187 [Tanacetum coccineum]|uniref:Uncharacterized protein n=1 Tax=Tanacetum coccineum TaxID=301880 RepID=A0ABQ4YSA7_9ASTR
MFNMNERVYNPQSQSASVTHQVLMFHPQSYQVIHPQSSHMIHPQSSHMIHPQSSQVIHPQSSQALAISLQSSADPLQFDSGLVVLYFLPTNDPLECLNKALAFMCTTLISSYPSTNNQLETSSNLMNQVDMQGRQTHSYVDGIDLYDSNCDDISTAKAVLMANLSSYGSDVLSEVPHSETYQIDMANQSVQAMQKFEQTQVVDFPDNEITSTREKMVDSQMDDMIKEKLALKQQTDSLEQNLSNQIKENESLLQTFTVFKNESKEKESKYIDNEFDLKMKIKELDNIVYKVGQSAQTVHIVISSQHDVIPANWIDEENMIIGRNTVNIVMHVDNKFLNVLHVQNTFLEDNIALDMMKMENDRLMELLVSQDLEHTTVNSLAVINNYQDLNNGVFLLN